MDTTLRNLLTLLYSGIAVYTALFCCSQIAGVDGVRHFCFACKNITNTSECDDLKYCHEGEVCFAQKSEVTGGDTYYTLGCSAYNTCPGHTTTTTVTIPTTINTTVPSNVTGTRTTTATLNTTTGATTSSTPGATVGATAKIKTPSSKHTITAPPLTTLTAQTSSVKVVPTRPAGNPPPIGRRIVGYWEQEDAAVDTRCCYTSQCNAQLFPETVDNSTCHDQFGFDCETANNTFGICKLDPHHAKSVCRKYCDLCSLIDGQWSAWTTFSSCDVTCGNGTNVRNRTCDNPPPKNGGLNCTGEATENQPCHPRDCPTHGNWAQWTEWTGCSVTCGVGLRLRDRNCTDPLPDPDGFYCFGRASEEVICFDDFCEEGNWTDWSEWGDCSRTCGSGLKHRRRNCTGDTLFTKPCTGDSSEARICNTKTCSGVKLPAFSVSGRPHESEGNFSIISITSHVITNIGNHYNTTTGIFTAPLAGIYEFFVSIEKQVRVGEAYCHLMRNDEKVITIAARSSVVDTGSYQEASNTVILELDQGDEVYLGYCTAPDTMSVSSAFGGILIHSN